MPRSLFAKSAYLLLLILMFFTIPQKTSAQGSDIPQKPLGLMLETYQYPYPVHYLDLYTQHHQLKMAYMDVHPQKANGKIVMLLHGKNFMGAYWGNTIKVLTAAGYRVVVPDQIGFGKSSKPIDVQYTLQWLADNTRQLLDTLGIKQLTVVGHSMGGMLAARFAMMFPEITQKLFLEDPIGLEDWRQKIPYETIEQEYQQNMKATYASLKSYQENTYYHHNWKPEYDQWLEVPYRWTLSPEYWKIAWNSALTTDMIFTQPICYEFGKIKCPTVLMVGEYDRTAVGKARVSEEVRKTLGNYPELGHKVASEIPDCKLIIVPGVGHIPMIQKPQVFYDALLSFLKQ